MPKKGRACSAGCGQGDSGDSEYIIVIGIIVIITCCQNRAAIVVSRTWAGKHSKCFSNSVRWEVVFSKLWKTAPVAHPVCSSVSIEHGCPESKMSGAWRWPLKNSPALRDKRKSSSTNTFLEAHTVIVLTVIVVVLVMVVVVVVWLC